MICLIGNSGLKRHGVDGQTAKVRLYLKKIKDEGLEVLFIDLEDFFRRPLSIFSKINKAIKICDRIVLISAQRGCKILLPYINFCNRKLKKPVILPLIGTNVLHYSMDKLSTEEKIDFLINKNYSLCKFDKKTSRQLSQLQYVLPETDLLSEVFADFFKINNVRTLNNFRDVVPITNRKKTNPKSLRLVFLSRVMREKGIFDLLEAVKELNAKGYNLCLDIYGNRFISKVDKVLFDSYLNEQIRYLGQVEFDSVIDVLSKYDLFVFPTRFIGEGTPGVIAESLIAGTPVLSSNFPQASILLEDGKNSLLYEINNPDDLIKKIKMLVSESKLLNNLTQNAYASGGLYTYTAERKKFLKYICGIEEVS